MNKLNLCKSSPISYYEPEEPALGEYLYCDKCADYAYEYCSIHGPLLIIPDNEGCFEVYQNILDHTFDCQHRMYNLPPVNLTPCYFSILHCATVKNSKIPEKTNLPSFVPRAALTVPHVFLHLAPSIIPGAGFGVFSTLTLPCGVRFGPYRGQHANNIKSMYCWQVYDRNHKPSHVVDAENANKSNWMRYVNCARHWREQNLVAYQYQGQLYYRTIKTIPRNTELMVFYGSEYACRLLIDIRRYTLEEQYQRIIGTSLMVIEDGSTNEVTECIETEDSVPNDCKECSTVSYFAFNEETITSSLNKYQPVNSNSLQLDDQTTLACKMNYDDAETFFGLDNNCKRSKNKIKPKCHYCDRELSSKSCLKRHLLIHSDNKPYHCTQCDYKTSIKYDLTRHTKTHLRNTYKNL